LLWFAFEIDPSIISALENHRAALGVAPVAHNKLALAERVMLVCGGEFKATVN
jgi:hypothetical protein